MIQCYCFNAIVTLRHLNLCGNVAKVSLKYAYKRWIWIIANSIFYQDFHNLSLILEKAQSLFKAYEDMTGQEISHKTCYVGKRLSWNILGNPISYLNECSSERMFFYNKDLIQSLIGFHSKNSNKMLSRINPYSPPKYRIPHKSTSSNFSRDLCPWGLFPVGEVSPQGMLSSWNAPYGDLPCYVGNLSQKQWRS